MKAGGVGLDREKRRRGGREGEGGRKERGDQGRGGGEEGSIRVPLSYTSNIHQIRSYGYSSDFQFWRVPVEKEGEGSPDMYRVPQQVEVTLPG